MRSFLAIELNQGTKDFLSSVQTELKNIGLDAKWVEGHNLHMTLKFLGEIDDAMLLKVKKSLEVCAARFTACEVALTGFGFFPNDRKPRVFFASTDQEARLRQIVSCLEDELGMLGFPKDDAFKSHITLARIKSPKNVEALKRALSSLESRGKFMVNGITLFKSVLNRQGPVYEVILKANFKS